MRYRQDYSVAECERKHTQKKYRGSARKLLLRECRTSLFA